MKLIVGLGNPGIEYQFTPHNAGFLAVDRIADDCGVVLSNRRGRALTAKARLAGHEVLLAKPETYMNLSGLSVAALVRELELEIPSEDLIVLYDELAFPLGRLRISANGRANGHNGVKSISGALGTEEWLRIRIGVGKPALADGREIKAGGRDYLLSQFRKQELAVLDEVLDRVEDAVEAVMTEGVSAAMNKFNRRPDDSENGSDVSKEK
ncbi:aminoacyl-tRNA hydrolase [Tunturiibacter gelidoferens]|uniref:Peptidyl-tRNA hydrolase n=1 Tax=Tunturiibacter gelidiferens TaxID=3069689 RepID=A0A9X0QBB5_9BACT|nr:aminoacyl-tRNA hydrolase [Edaphobacter lichenicola]MBB5327103.1 PTH1 family peptidyl-tRNA hydrolase [Edaphobacter lichenicola]